MAPNEPPYCNHGGQVFSELGNHGGLSLENESFSLPSPVDNSTWVAPCWDWYAATVESSPDAVLAEVSRRCDLSDIEGTPGLHGYSRGAKVTRGSYTYARVLWGGNDDRVHIWGTGRAAPFVAGVVRREYPDHLVSRFDSAVDFKGASWELVQFLALGLADQHRVGVTHVGDFHRGEKGRTLYLGAPTSVVRVRIYEKGIKEDADPSWIRAECQVRPKRNREQGAHMAPADVWGSSKWSAALLLDLTGLGVSKYRCGTLYRPTDAESAINFMLKQYSARMRQRAQEIGHDEVLQLLTDSLTEQSL